MRSGWASESDVGPIIRNLAKLGVEFYPSWPRPAHSVSPSPSQPTLGRRPAGYKPTLVDYGVYIQRRDVFLRSPRGRAALFYGGIVGRLARLVLSDFTDVACLPPSDDVIKTGAPVLTGNGALWREALTEDEIDIICEVYTVETGQTSNREDEGRQLKFVSWWPKPTAFASSGLNTGWWNANCERWFVKCLKEMQTMRVKLHTYSEWKNKLRFSTAARKVNTKNDELSARYLAARLS
ncbi:hypothetical protein C8R43DRAFT_1080520 [Mycena crocata]|nr:hypothetical protein C8R43DRAFT_1080520 [Mycena crocata]